MLDILPWGWFILINHWHHVITISSHISHTDLYQSVVVHKMYKHILLVTHLGSPVAAIYYKDILLQIQSLPYKLYTKIHTPRDSHCCATHGQIHHTRTCIICWKSGLSFPPSLFVLTSVCKPPL